MKKSDEVRLHVYMARCGVASRRKCEELIAAGHVSVDGQPVTTLGARVHPDADVRVDGRRIRMEARNVYLALNKPKEYLCSAVDPEARPLALDLLRPHFSERLFSVGRLDFLSSGLILYTNDGEFARAVSHPSSRIEKEYRVDTKRPIPVEKLEEYRSGLTVEGERYRLVSYEMKNPRRVHLTLVEGKNREIRRVFALWRIGVKRIHRVRIGTIHLKGLPPGSYRHLTQKEVDWLSRRASLRGGQ